MKKVLAMLLAVALTVCLFAACGEKNDTNTTTTQEATTAESTTVPEEETTAPEEEETTAPEEEETTAPEEETTAPEEEETTTKEATTTAAPTTAAPTTAAAARPNPANSANWKKVVDGVFTSAEGGIQLDCPGWKTYGLYSISMVPEEYANVGQTNAICVAVYNAESGSMDTPEVFENKTEEDFESVLAADITSFTKGKISYGGKTYTCYKAVAPDGPQQSAYYVWVFQTDYAKYFINFMQYKGMANVNMQTVGENMMKTIRIFK